MKPILEYVSQNKKIPSINEYVSQNEKISSINEYLLNKKNQTAISVPDIEEYCIVVAFTEIKIEYIKFFNDAKFPNNANSNPDFSYYWLLPIDFAKEYNKKYAGLALYKIPDFCHTLDEVKQAGKDGRLDIDDLEEIY